MLRRSSCSRTLFLKPHLAPVGPLDGCVIGRTVPASAKPKHRKAQARARQKSEHRDALTERKVPAHKSPAKESKKASTAMRSQGEAERAKHPGPSAPAHAEAGGLRGVRPEALGQSAQLGAKPQASGCPMPGGRVGSWTVTASAKPKNRKAQAEPGKKASTAMRSQGVAERAKPFRLRVQGRSTLVQVRLRTRKRGVWGA